MIKAYGFDQGASRDVGILFIPEVSKTLANGTCAGHHNGVVQLIGRGTERKTDDTELGWHTDFAYSDFKECRGGQRMPDKENFNCVIGGNMKTVVRRLMPIECERLQGFPDNWTSIGEWTDSKGKKHKDADSPRYKALGNSIAVGYANNQSGFWMWLMKRISATYERSATLGSMFDGIGGFPLAWEFYNGKGSARWASEIEEFPIAVTKYHFGEE